MAPVQHIRTILLPLIALFVVPPLAAVEPPPAKPTPVETAAKVDAALTRGSPPGTPLPAAADDATFLRRVYLDLTGKLPEPEALRRFVGDPSPVKRAKVIDELLETEAYAVNWGRYWRDTVTYHTPASANYLRWKLFDDWWTDATPPQPAVERGRHRPRHRRRRQRRTGPGQLPDGALRKPD